VKAPAPIRRPSAFEAYVACLQNTEMENSMTDQERRQLATSFIEALRAGDANGFRAIMADDVFWTLPGKSLVSGIANGVEAF
jgi:ketosteroid isomerase-like protein